MTIITRLDLHVIVFSLATIALRIETGSALVCLLWDTK